MSLYINKMYFSTKKAKVINAKAVSDVIRTLLNLLDWNFAVAFPVIFFTLRANRNEVMQSPIMNTKEMRIKGNVGSRIAIMLVKIDKLHLKISAK